MKKSEARSRGAMLIETLIAALISVMIGGALVVMLQAEFSASGVILGEESTYMTARRALNTLADTLRNAQPYPGGSGGQYLALQAGGANSITAYLDSGGDTVQYGIGHSGLMQTQTMTGKATTTTAVSGATSLLFTYYVSAGGALNGPSSGWTTTANPNAPTATELPNVGAILITASVNVGGYAQTISTLVRLRNSPYNGQSGP